MNGASTRQWEREDTDLSLVLRGLVAEGYLSDNQANSAWEALSKQHLDTCERLTKFIGEVDEGASFANLTDQLSSLSHLGVEVADVPAVLLLKAVAEAKRAGGVAGSGGAVGSAGSGGAAGAGAALARGEGRRRNLMVVAALLGAGSGLLGAASVHRGVNRGIKFISLLEAFIVHNNPILQGVLQAIHGTSGVVKKGRGLLAVVGAASLALQQLVGRIRSRSRKGTTTGSGSSTEGAVEAGDLAPAGAQD